MKNKIFNFSIKTLLIFGLMIFVLSCNESFLNEVPKDFLSAENVYTDRDGFETAITNLHSDARNFWAGSDGPTYWILPGLGTDFGVYGENFNSGPRMDYTTLSPTDEYANVFWKYAFTLIKDANTIISRAEYKEVKWNSEKEKMLIIAEARFFRAFAYRMLANLFGGVPIIESEITAPKTDFVRSSRDEVYQFAKEDLTYAAANLPEPDTENAPGRITKGAANHLLAEINISLGNWQEAIDAASEVINHPSYTLMTNRFGARTGVEGDVFWDLFQRGNQNRTSGNTEAIWVVQIEWSTKGGGDVNSGGEQHGYTVERGCGARYFDIKDPDGASGFVLSDELGRGVGWLTPTYYVQQTIWQTDWDNDIRNASHNIKRQYYYNNPESKYYGQLATPEVLASQELRYYFPTFMKATTPWDHPDAPGQGYIFRDIYAMRLAETYLLRAEAYLGKEDKINAAADINVIRARAQATAISPSDVDIDLILDERARELYTEEFRTCTLMRLGILYERTKKYSMILKGDGSVIASNPSLTIKEYNNLWPIPQSSIDLNGGAVLEQNPGY